MNYFKRVLQFVLLPLFIFLTYLFFYWPVRYLIYHSDTLHYFIQARQGVFEILPFLINYFHGDIILVGFVLIFFLSCAVSSLFFLLTGSYFLAFFGTILVFINPYLYQAIHLGIVDNVILIVGAFVLFLSGLYSCKKKWWLLISSIIAFFVLWNKPLSFLWTFPSYWQQYMGLKVFYVQELLNITPIQTILGLFFLILAFYYYLRKKSWFWAVLPLIYAIIFVLSLFMRRFYLFLIPLQILYILLIIKEFKLSKTRSNKIFLIGLIFLIVGFNYDFYVLDSPEIGLDVINDLDSLKGYNLTIVTEWSNGNAVLFWSGIRPSMHSTPDESKMPLFADAMMSCDFNESQWLLRSGNHKALIKEDLLDNVFLILFPSDINKFRAWERISQYNLTECSLFFKYFGDLNSSRLRIINLPTSS